MADILPIDFFTIVLNGEPFIRHHLEVFKELKLPWTWHIIEGLAAHKNDTSWGAHRGGKLPEEFLKTARSQDGTSEYLDEITAKYPDNIRLYRKPLSVPWDGKVEMVNAPIPKILRETLLWQIDADELWTVEQIEKLHSMFVTNPQKTSAWFYCHFFVNPEYCSSLPDVYGNFTRSEWLRVWRLIPGDFWAAHEPPTLARKNQDGTTSDIGRIAPFTQRETADAGLRFQHFAYTTREQVRFKEDYYGYKGAVADWEKMQSVLPSHPRFRDYMPWVHEMEIGRSRTFRTLKRKLLPVWTPASRALPARRNGIAPLARRNALGNWSFGTHAIPAPDAPHIALVRTDRIGDHLLFFGMIPALRAAYPHARITLVCPKDVVQLLPYHSLLDGIIEFDREKAHQDSAYQLEIVAAIQSVPVDILLCPQYARDNLTNKLSTLVAAGKRIGFASESNVNRKSHVRKYEKFARQFDELIPVANREIPELSKYGELLRKLGVKQSIAAPFFQPTETDIRAAEKLISELGLTGKPLIVVFPCAANSIRNVLQLGRALRGMPELQNFSLVGLGDACHENAIKQVIADSGMQGASVAGRTSLSVAAAVMQKCKLVVGADTGLGHMACAAGAKNVILLGGGDFGRFFPYSKLTTAAILPLSCYQCHFDCTQSEPFCLTAIPDSTVQAAIRHALSNDNSLPTLFASASCHPNKNVEQLRTPFRSIKALPGMGDFNFHEV